MSESGFFRTLKGLLVLLRPPNLITAAADILAGWAVAGFWSGQAPDGDLLLQSDLALLILASVSLYGGGVVLNDRADADLDAVERPERPIPSGAVSKGLATSFALLLFSVALLLAYGVGFLPLLVAAGTVAMVAIYDLVAKSHALWGPVSMGLCRSGNLMLGASLFLPQATGLWPFLLIPLLYIAAITWISRFEVDGGGQQSGWLAIGSVGLIAGGLTLFGVNTVQTGRELVTLLLLALLFTGFTLPAFLRARRSGTPEDIQRAVKRGVLSLILLNSLIAATVGAVGFALIILSLLPVSLGVARLFRVT